MSRHAVGQRVVRATVELGTQGAFIKALLRLLLLIPFFPLQILAHMTNHISERKELQRPQTKNCSEPVKIDRKLSRRARDPVPMRLDAAFAMVLHLIVLRSVSTYLNPCRRRQCAYSEVSATCLQNGCSSLSLPLP